MPARVPTPLPAPLSTPLSRRLRTALACASALATASSGLLLATPAVAAAAPAPATTAATTAAVGTATATTQYPDYAPTPPMGWNDWSYYQCGINEQTILGNARALVSTGLAKKGFDTVTIDDCWMAQNRDAKGNLVANPTEFPHGMAYIGQQLHKLGLKFGIYEDAGTQTCGGFPGSMGHWQQDANLFASWGVDYVKLDGCNVPTPSGETDEQAYHATYAAMSQALLDTHRRIVFSISAPAYFQGESNWNQVIGWSAQLGNLWREGADIALGQDTGPDKWASIDYNYSYNVGLAGLQRPGRWNDPDFLLAGDSGLTQDEIQSQVSLWSMMAAPLISSTDLTHLSPTALDVLGNKDVIAVDQDRLGVQGRIVAHGTGYDVLAKPLANGDRAVALFNSSDAAQTISVAAKTAGLPSAKAYRLTDLVTKKVTETTGAISADVPPHATVLYRVAAGAGAGLAPATAITWHDVSTAAKPGTYRITLADHGSTALTGVRLTVAAPKGWTVSPSAASLPRVPAGGSASATVHLSGPTPAPGTTVTPVTATATYRGGGVAGQQTVVQVVPYPTLAAAFDNVGATSESATTPGNFDGSGDSYSSEALTKAGAAPGATVNANGLSFVWPTAAPGTPDNVSADGQEITLTGQGSALGFLGAEAGFVSGPVTVTYTDGTTSTGQLGFPNWCCAPTNAYGAQTAFTMDHRNTPTGPANYGISYGVFTNTVPLLPGKTVRSVTLPEEPAIHIFGITVKS
ncbi:NEW3 domain-containing protein [Streptacidiphilus fuscans]|uniref:Alpha-galactosidase n=1 Tax=Streptacidiphilus fuscans TaxID=2789292 RepID=A0A931B7W6_9ACTN|nr:NEW3 domain-containing protein [Streptacidiphilus fuscans]MBF9072069.1 alpha-galactosidase [Streptacidiphilus fuscans]